MKTYDIDLGSFLPKSNVITGMKENMLYITTTKRLSIKLDKDYGDVGSYVYLPNMYRLPVRIDLTAKIDTPSLYLFWGNGHINFGTPWSDNRRIDDIADPDKKVRFFHNHIQMGEFVDISVIYDLKVMQILVNGEERYYSEKERYMKSKLFKENNDSGFAFKIACSKRTNLCIKALRITEYDQSAGIVHTAGELPAPAITNEAVEKGQKPDFENSTALLPDEIRDEIIKTDIFLRSLKPMKFKRQIEKYGNKITYLASDHGFSYAIYPSNDIMHHSLSWYIITSGKPETWHRKADLMEVTLKRLSETSPEIARRMFFNLKECVACCPCIVKTLYEFEDKKKLACHGLMEFKMNTIDFDDVRTFIGTVNTLI